MILVVGGTSEGRNIAAHLEKLNPGMVITTAVTPYGSKLASTSGSKIKAGALSIDGFIKLLKDNEIKAVIDATHPFAKDASNSVIQATEKTGVKYLRYERPRLSMPKYSKLIVVDDFTIAAEKSFELDNTVLLTIGSKNIAPFVDIYNLNPEYKLFARVLPDSRFIAQCEDKGLTPANIIAMQGPFSQQFNSMLIKELNAGVLVTKDSGASGGQEEKIEAAMKENIWIVLVARPSLEYPEVYEKFEDIYQRISNLLEVKK